MSRINNLKDVLDYIDIGITANINKDHYILYISMMHNFFLNYEGNDFGIRYSLLKQTNLSNDISHVAVAQNFYNLYMFKVCRHSKLTLSFFSKIIENIKLKLSGLTKLLTGYPMIYHTLL